MTHTITIQTNNSTHFEQIKKLAQKLGVITSERHDDSTVLVSEKKKQAVLSDKEQEKLFKGIYGSWDGDETADELVNLIYSARSSSTREIEL